MTTGWIRVECCCLESVYYLDVKSHSDELRLFKPIFNVVNPEHPVVYVTRTQKAGYSAHQLTRISSFPRYEHHRRGLTSSTGPHTRPYQSREQTTVLRKNPRCGRCNWHPGTRDSLTPLTVFLVSSFHVEESNPWMPFWLVFDSRCDYFHPFQGASPFSLPLVRASGAFGCR